MREEFVRRRGWLDDATFVDFVGLSNLLPGPTSTELALHIGHRRAGWAGFLVAGIGFIAPAVAIVLALAWAYVAFGSRPEAGALLEGIAPVVVAIVAYAGIALGRTALRSVTFVAVAAVVIAASVAGVSEIFLLLGAGVVTLLIAEIRNRTAPPAGTPGAAGAAGAAAAGALLALDGSDWRRIPALAAAVATSAVTIAPLAVFLEFLKIGAVIFGSGYVLVAFLRSELVVNLGWITDAQLLDAVAVGQVTPGPLFSTATFIGYLLGGVPAAAAATVGIFLPAFIAVALSVRVFDRLRASRRARAFLDGVNAAAVGLLVVVAAQLARDAFIDPLAVIVGVVALALLVRGRIGTGWLILAGAVVGVVRLALGVS